MKTIIEVEEWLYRQPRGLKRGDMSFMMQLIAEFNIDTHSMDIIHVTGTNGKGSTISYLSNILLAHGKQVATFTSPHIYEINERFVRNNVTISDEQLCQYVTQIKERGIVLSQFEIMTLAFFLFINDNPVDYIILEVGIGGLLDTTNFVKPIASIVTTVGLDHTELLGDTIEKIAYQKAGIIKCNTPVFVGRLDKQALNVIVSVANLKNALLIQTADVFPVNNNQLVINDVELPIVIQGAYQKDNLSLALHVAKYVLSSAFELENTKIGLSQVYWPGRFETVYKNPLIIVDGAHNPHGIQGLIDTLQSESYKQKRVQLLFAALPKKDYVAMLMNLMQYYPITLTTFDVVTPQQNIEYTNVPEGIAFVSDYKTFVKAYLANPTSDVLVVTGSLYFVSEFKKFVEKMEISSIL